MKQNFNACFDEVIGSEGGYQNDRNDRGNWTGGRIGRGVNKGTKYGVSAASYPKLDIRNLTLEDARSIYKEDYWDVNSCDDLPSGIDHLVFDIGINHGTRDGAVFLQKALGTTADGIVGPNTLAAANSQDPFDVIRDICMVRCIDYANISTVSRYGRGWYRRVVDTLRFADKLASGPTLDQSKAEPANDDKEPQGFWTGLGFRRVRNL